MRGAAAMTRVQVKQGRRGRELRIDGTFASYYEPGRAATGSVWDALSAPVLLCARRAPRVLILGLGGGSAARLIRALAPRAHLVGVEANREVVETARRHLDLDRIGAEVVVAFAEDYLAGCRRRFDLVIEDLFVGREDTLRKPAGFPAPGIGRIAARLAPGGLLVVNTIEETRAVGRELARCFAAQVECRIAGYDNRVRIAGPRGLTAGRLRAAFAAEPLLAAARAKFTLRTRTCA